MTRRGAIERVQRLTVVNHPAKVRAGKSIGRPSKHADVDVPQRLRQPSHQLLENDAPRGFIGIDDDAAAWDKALTKLALPWSQGRIESSAESTTSSVPSYWVLDPTGKIVAKTSDAKELATILEDKLK